MREDRSDAPAAPRLGDSALHYAAVIKSIRSALQQGEMSGLAAVAARAQVIDSFLQSLWGEKVLEDGSLGVGIALIAVGGYGRQELFPCSDLDLLFLLRDPSLEKIAKAAIRGVAQRLWDAGIRVASTTRAVGECLRFDPENAEFTLSLLDARFVAGDTAIAKSLTEEALPELLRRERRSLAARLMEMTRGRHTRYGNTLFHLEPNIKEAPGGLRDAHVATWLARLHGNALPNDSAEFERAFGFLSSVRCFLHLRHNRDDNVLDWRAQDEAAANSVGATDGVSRDPSGFMQLYFRQARVVARRLEQEMDAVPVAGSKGLLRLPAALRRRRDAAFPGLAVENGRVVLQAGAGLPASIADPETVLRLFELIAQTGARPSLSLEAQVEDALPSLSAQMDEGTGLWQRLSRILLGRYAGTALRSMHTLGVLELILPEFHGIDALVVRDAYHRYTVDEHTFVLIDALHALPVAARGMAATSAERFGAVLAEMEHADLLYLGALLHDTGKGRSTDHTIESTRLAEGVVRRLELDEYESGLVLNLIRHHLEMSAALRRDIFDGETVRNFAAKVQTPEGLRMLALFTYADIQAVNPDALTPWKAENLWRLYMATSNFLDRNIDEDRVDARVSSELLQQMSALLPEEAREALRFLEGFPQRYLQTRSPEDIRSEFLMSKRLLEDPVQLELNWSADRSEITLVTPDRRLLFARVAGVLSGWGMNIITADAFSNALGIVVDSFRFTDLYRTLELNPGERERLRTDVHAALADDAAAQRIISGRKRGRRRDPLLRVETALTFDMESSTHATVLQVVAQDHPGLLYAISTVLGEAGCNIELAVIDTEGDTAIDVFYLTREGRVLDEPLIQELRGRLGSVIAANAL